MFLLIARRPCSFRRRLGKRFVRHSVGFEVQSYQVSGAKGSVERFLRRRKQGFPPTPLRCPQTLAITTFLTNSIVPDSSKKHLFYPSAISRKLAELILAVGHFPTAFAKISQMTDITFLKMPSNRRKIFSIIKPCTLL